MKNINFIGQFEIKKNIVRIIDPCYDRNTWRSGCINDVKTGIWEIRIKNINKRVGEIHVYHVDIKKDTIKKPHWIEQDFEIGVDSSLCGIFDDNIYPYEETDKYNEDDTFYEKCCDLTMGGVGVMDGGVVCASGYGDGSYMCYTLEEKGQTVGIKVVFIDDENEDDYEDDYEDEYEYDDIN